MVRGIWVHQDRQRDRERALRWIKARCGHANLYWGHKPHVKQIDANCARCGRRVRFNPNKTDRRGKVRQAIWISRPADSRQELESKVHHLNSFSNGNDGGGHEGFVTALELMKNKSPSIIGGKSE
jgi:hypothetical protein